MANTSTDDSTQEVTIDTPGTSGDASNSVDSTEAVTKEMTEELAEILGSATRSPEVASTPASGAGSPAPSVEVEAVETSVQSPVPPTEAAASTERGTDISEAVRPTPVAATPTIESGTPAYHQEMGHVLTQAVAAGKHEVPADADPLICKPQQLSSWRVFKIMSEFVEGFELIGKYGLAATFFGTARSSFEDHFYKECTELAGRLAKSGYAVITGGSAGIMQAANQGAFEAGGASVGLNIKLDDSQGMNEFLTDSMTFEHFFARKVMLAYASDVYIYFPGGFGTLDEFTEILTLVQTKKIKRIPIVLYGKEYWDPLVDFFRNKLLNEHQAVDGSDMELFRVVDSVDEAFAYIQDSVKEC